MIRPLLLLLALLTLAPCSVRAADQPVTVDQARSALDVLNDPKKREAFAATLQTILKAQAAPQTPADATGLEPDSMGAQMLLALTRFARHTQDRLIAAVQTAQSLPLLWAWIWVMTTNPVGQSVLIEVSQHLLIAILASLVIDWAARRVSRKSEFRLHQAIEALLPDLPDSEDRAELGEIEAPPPVNWWSVPRRLWFSSRLLILSLLPLLGVFVVGHVLAGSALGGSDESRLVILAVTSAWACSGAVIAIIRMLLSPGAGHPRLMPLDDEAGLYLTRWLQRLTVIGIGGYTIAEVSVLLGLSGPAHTMIQRVTGLLVTLGLGSMILSQRLAVRRALHSKEGTKRTTAALRNVLAHIWHWVALLALAAFWLDWASVASINNVVTGRYVLLTLLVLAVTKLLLMLLMSLIDQLPALGARASDWFPGLETRLELYHPLISLTVRGIVHVLAAMTLLQIYGTGSLSWLWGTTGGQRVLSGVLTVLVTITLAVAVWEAVNAAIQRHLNGLARDAQAARSARLRTLLPLLRTSLLIAIIVIAMLMILSEIGVNIAPLLAGAGILGVAIGFGSQKLVQDLITGIFLLLENALQVGDFVNAAGVSGKVEGLSVRTIRLRATDGSVHIVPFSSVTSVTNFSRGVGNADVRVTVEVSEDPDRVADVLRAVVAELRADSDFSAKITADLLLFGVDKIEGGGMTITGQVPCLDTGRWLVQREINRRVKLRFQVSGIRYQAQGLPYAE